MSRNVSRLQGRLVLGGVVLLGAFAFYCTRKTPEAPAPSVFTAVTGLKVGLQWNAVAGGSEYGGFGSEGESYLVFRLSKADFDALLNSAAPWSGQWKSGPVEDVIGGPCTFGTRDWAKNALDEHVSATRVEELLTSTTVFFDAQERCCAGNSWHNGDVVLLDPQDSTVWWSSWDF